MSDNFNMYYRSGILVYSNPWRTYWYCRTYPRYRRQEKWWKGHGNRWYCYVNYYHRTCSYQCYCWCLSADIKCLEPVIIT